MTDQEEESKNIAAAAIGIATAVTLFSASPAAADVKKEDTKAFARRSMPLDDFYRNYYALLMQMKDVPNWKSIPSHSGTARIRASDEELQALLNFRI